MSRSQDANANEQKQTISKMETIETMSNNKQIKNGDVFDIGQTVNGVSKFLWFNNNWYYFEERLSREYEYDQDELTKTVQNWNDLEEITFIKNIFDTTNIKILAVNHLPLGSTLEGR